MADDSQFYTSVLREFNEYSVRENLNIELDLNVLSSGNSTIAASPSNFVSLLGTLYRKKEIKYDIIFYFNFFIDSLDKYFVDFNKYIKGDHMKLFDPQVLSLTCTKSDKKENKLIGLVRF